ncbi:MAG: protein kinase [Sandaracinaceae bacterium]|nr:protein kinase [Sandaracinaceae bacterium]
MEPAAADPMIGRLLDQRYRITSRLGQGGMGIVYRARHEVLDAAVAIKLLRSDAAGDDEAIERLTREAQAASAIGDEHIVDVRDVGRLEDGSTFVVMELIEGVDLYNVVRRAPLPWTRARHVALQICEALQAAHDRGIVHRDLKLENVLLTMRRGDPDFVKIVDFGIAKVQGTAKITIAGRVIGTPEYMSPEQCMGRTVDHRTDIYSLGVMLYEMVTGTLPFYDDDLAALVRMQIHEKPVPPSRVRGDAELPLAFEAVILRCIAKDPEARFGSMSAVGAALEAIEAGPERPAAAAEPASEPEAVLARPTTGSGEARAGRPVWLAPALVLLALGAGTLAYAALQSDPRPASMSDDPPGASSAPAPVDAPREPEPVAAPARDPSPAVVERAASSAHITIESVPPGASVLDDSGALLGETPFRVRRPAAGQRLPLLVRSEGYAPHAVALSELSAPELRVVLERRATARALRSEAPPRAPPEREAPPPERPRPETEEQRPRSHQEFLDPWGNER